MTPKSAMPLEDVTSATMKVNRDTVALMSARKMILGLVFHRLKSSSTQLLDSDEKLN